MLSLYGTKLNFTTAYHPQSDGQTEVRNRGLEQYLRAFTANKPSKWSNFLPWAELALNCFHHAGLGTSPFKALYGREPPSLVAAPPTAKTPPNIAELIRQRGALLVELRRNLEKAQQRMSESANRHRRHVEFEVGDLVWLKLQPYRQHSVAKPESVKLAKRFYGPFEVVQRVGPVAYRLRLPEGSRIHDVFHVSLLRDFVAGVQPHPITELPKDFVGDRPIVKPVSILDSKVMWHEGEAVEHVLIRWSDGSESHSWEPLAWIKDRFPSIPLEGKVVPNGEGVDTSITEVMENGNVGAPEAAITTETAGPEEEANPTAAPTHEEESIVEEVAQGREPEVASSARVLRPRDRLKPPEKLQDFVAR